VAADITWHGLLARVPGSNALGFPRFILERHCLFALHEMAKRPE
jgi:hypothetical protein